ncbi:MAG: two-component system, OmpR family, sensor kinase [Gaiellales bacterium]|jgi:signal transduction histidine kinase|nr:two-component system, OmpR family, sensor kinase [Gaiellales bacterium]
MNALTGPLWTYFRHRWWPEATLAAACVWWLVLMVTWEGWEALPFHFIFIGVSVVYGLRMWHVRTAAVAIGLVAVTTGALTMLAVARGTEGTAELAEVPLMSLLFLTMVLHVNTRQRVAGIISQLLEQERRLRAYATHELMTPLTVARGEIELLARQPAARPEQLTRAHDVVLEELRRAEQVVGDLLLAARVAVATPSTERINADDLVFDTAERWHEHVPGRLVVHGVACGTIDVARDDLLRALDNILANAARYSGADAIISIGSVARAERLQIRIEDTGPGIASEDLPHIFEWFYRSAATRLSDRQGSGLGLAIVRNVVEAHGGTVAIESEPGQGTAVIIELPGFVPDGSPRERDAHPRVSVAGRQHSLS